MFLFLFGTWWETEVAEEVFFLLSVNNGTELADVAVLVPQLLSTIYLMSVIKGMMNTHCA